MTIPQARPGGGAEAEGNNHLITLHAHLTAELLDSAPDAIVVVDSEGRIALTNKQALKTFGYSREELIGRSIEILIPPRFGERHLMHRMRYMHESKARPMGSGHELFALRKDGSEFPVEISLSPLETDEGMLVSAAIRDVAERRARETELERLAAIVQTSDDAIYSYALDGTILSWNRAAERLFGYTAGEMVGRSVDLLLPRGMHDEAKLIHDAIRRGEDFDRIKTLRVRKNGSPVEVSMTISPIRTETGEVTETSVIVRDMTANIESERALKEANERFTSAFNNSLIGMVLADVDGSFTQVNPSFCEIIGYPQEEMLELTETMITHDEDRNIEEDSLERLINGEISSYQVEKRYGRADGTFVWTLVRVSPIERSAGRVTHVLRQVEDITERRQAVERLLHQALHDSLTGLANRTLLLDRLRQALARAQRTRAEIAVMFIDLDHFKVINDSLGHAEGDKVLVAIADRLRSTVRPGDTVARFGGDEFVIICEGLGDETSEAIAARITASIEQPISLSAGDIVLSSSIGIALTRGESEPDALLRKADIAMYRAKAKGRARSVTFDTEMEDLALKRLNVERDLRVAIRHGDLRVYYQPQIRLVDNEISGVEALVRWAHPTEGLLHPTSFITIAEDTGLIVPLGHKVLEEALTSLDILGETLHHHGLKLAVNVSARELSRPHYVDQVVATVENARADPGRICLEITEGAIVNVGESALWTLSQLRDFGLQIVLDDFGTGFSSLTHLRDLPVDIIKIDRSFIAGIDRDKQDLAITDALITLAHDLDIQCVAEGIERPRQQEVLVGLGCDVAQGFYFSRPLPLDELAKS